MTIESCSLPADHRSGFIAVIGRPNVGKSTLFNRLLGQKIAITSPKPQTTRDQILGVLTEPSYQMIFLDTPGIHRPKNRLGEYMMGVVEETIGDADLLLWLVDAQVSPTAEDVFIVERLQELAASAPLPPILIGLNKQDGAPADVDKLEGRTEEYRRLLQPLLPPSAPPATAIAFSALTSHNMPRLLAVLCEMLPLGPRYFPEDQITDLQVRFLVAELIREQALLLLQQEIPHSVAVVVDEFVERSEEMTYISAVIYVERESQKGIVLGRSGAVIKRIGQAARPEIEELVGTKVYLELWVKVWEKWRRREGMLRRLGYSVR